MPCASSLAQKAMGYTVSLQEEAEQVAYMDVDQEELLRLLLVCINDVSDVSLFLQLCVFPNLLYLCLSYLAYAT